MKLAVGIHFSFSSSLSRVVDVRALLARKPLSGAEEKFWEMGLEGGTESMLYAIRCGIQGVGVVDRDSPGHEEGTGLGVVKSSPT